MSAIKYLHSVTPSLCKPFETSIESIRCVMRRLDGASQLQQESHCMLAVLATIE